jgi:hypothetical protein
MYRKAVDEQNLRELTIELLESEGYRVLKQKMVHRRLQSHTHTGRQFMCYYRRCAAEPGLHHPWQGGSRNLDQTSKFSTFRLCRQCDRPTRRARLGKCIHSEAFHER